MPVTVQCDQCGFQYAAPEALIGKRVRCKHCSSIFTVTEASSDVSLSLLQSADPDNAALSETDDIDSILRGGDGQESIHGDNLARIAKPFDYPYSREVERFLPPVLLVISLLLIVSQTLSQDDLGRRWLLALRLLILVGLYAVVVFPITYMGVRHGVRKQGGHMPWSPRWKTFAIFTIAYALSYMLWLAGANIASLLLGCLAGLAVSLTAVWLIFRLRLERGVEPLVWGGVAFVVAVLLSGGFLAGLNLTTFAITSGSRTAHTFAASPILPGLSWDPAPVTDEPAGPPSSGTPAPVTPAPETVEVATLPSVEEAEGDAPTDQPDSAAQPKDDQATEVVTTATPTEQDDAVTPTNDVTDPSPVAPHQEDTSVAVIEDQPSVLTEVEVQEPTDEAGIQPSDLVEVVHPAIDAGFERLIYPLVGSDFVAVIRDAGDEDIVERWRTTDWTSTAQARFRPDPNIGEQYAISPDGAQLARIVSWPTLSIQVWDFDEQRVSGMIELETQNGAPALLGFVSPTHVLLKWQKGGAHAVQLIDLQTRRRAGVVLDGVETLYRNFALSADGRMFSVAGRTREGPAVIVYSVSGGRPIRVLPIRLLDPRWGVRPTGLAFSPDGAMLAAWFEQDGNGLLVNWSVVNSRETQPHIFPAGSLPSRSTEGKEPVFSYLHNGQVLLYGRDLVDLRTGRLIGSTGVETVQAQRVTDSGIHVVYLDGDGQTRLAVLNFKKDEDKEQP